MKRSRNYKRGWFNGLHGESIPQVGTYGCEGSRLSHRGPEAGNKEVQPIRESKRTEGSVREETKNDIRETLRS